MEGGEVREGAVQPSPGRLPCTVSPSCVASPSLVLNPCRVLPWPALAPSRFPPWSSSSPEARRRVAIAVLDVLDVIDVLDVLDVIDVLDVLDVIDVLVHVIGVTNALGLQETAERERKGAGDAWREAAVAAASRDERAAVTAVAALSSSTNASAKMPLRGQDLASTPSHLESAAGTPKAPHTAPSLSLSLSPPRGTVPAASQPREVCECEGTCCNGCNGVGRQAGGRQDGVAGASWRLALPSCCSSSSSIASLALLPSRRASFS